MTKGERLMLSLVFSPWTQVGRGVLALVSCLIILRVIDMDKIDALTYAVPQEYLPVMLIAVIIMGGLVMLATRKWLHERAADNKVAKGEIPDTNSLPFDKRYDAGTAVAFILGAGLGLFLAPAALDQVVINAGMWLHMAAAAVLTAVFVPMFILILHWGIRQFLVNVSKYAVDLSKTVTDVVADLQQAGIKK